MAITERDRKAAARVAEKCVRDADLRKRLEASPEKVLAEAGVRLPAGTQIELHENTATLMHYTLPFRRCQGAMNDADLEHVAGGVPDDLVGGYGSSNSYFAAEYRAWRRENGFS